MKTLTNRRGLCLAAIVVLISSLLPAFALAGHPLIANQGRKLCWFDANGEVTATKQLKSAPHDIHVLPSGNILTHQGTEVIELHGKSHEIVWSFETKKLATADRVELHSIAPLNQEMLMVALSGEGKIFEIDREGKVLHTINLKRDRPHPHRDTRLVRPVMNDGQRNYLVAQEGDGFVRQYDRDGKIVWEYDVPLFGKQPKKGHGPEAFGDAVFSATRLRNGNTMVATGNGHSLLEVTPDKEIVWQIHQNDLDGIRLAWVTTVQVLDNGNFIVGNCHAGEGQPQIIEIDRDKNVVWSLMDFEDLGNSVSNSALLDTPVN